MPRFDARIIRDTTAGKLTPALYEPRVKAAVKRWLEKVRDRAADKAPRNTGAMADSLRVTDDGITSNSRKIRYVHGRFAIPSPPRRRTVAHMPPDNQSIRRWSNAKGIPTFLVRRAIAQRGTPIVPFVSEATEELEGEFANELERAANEIERAWGR